MAMNLRISASSIRKARTVSFARSSTLFGMRLLRYRFLKTCLKPLRSSRIVDRSVEIIAGRAGSLEEPARAIDAQRYALTTSRGFSVAEAIFDGWREIERPRTGAHCVRVAGAWRLRK
jgi:hypothetical protein